MEQYHQDRANHTQFKTSNMQTGIQSSALEVNILKFELVLTILTIIVLAIFAMGILSLMKTKNTEMSILNTEKRIITVLSFLKTMLSGLFLFYCFTSYRINPVYLKKFEGVADRVLNFSAFFIFGYFLVILMAESALKILKDATVPTAVTEKKSMLEHLSSKVLKYGLSITSYFGFAFTYKVLLSVASKCYEAGNDEMGERNVQLAAMFFFMATYIELYMAYYYDSSLTKIFTKVSTFEKSTIDSPAITGIPVKADTTTTEPVTAEEVKADTTTTVEPVRSDETTTEPATAEEVNADETTTVEESDTAEEATVEPVTAEVKANEATTKSATAEVKANEAAVESATAEEVKADETTTVEPATTDSSMPVDNNNTESENVSGNEI